MIVFFMSAVVTILICLALVLHVTCGSWGLDVPNSRTKPKSIRSPTTSHRLAVHEAGHAIVARFCTLTSEIKEVTIESETGGHMLHYTMPTKDVESDWCRLVIALGGLAAEGAAEMSVQAMSVEEDLQKSHTLAESIVRMKGQLPWPVKMGTSFPFGQMFVERPSDAVLRVITEGYAVAKRLLALHQTMHARLVSLLLAHRTVDVATLEKVLGKRTYIKFLEGVTKTRLIKPTFVLPSGARWN
jgi:cell division protease FtsH